MNDLEQYFRNNDNRLIDKWIHYFEVYDRHFSRFRNKGAVMLEIGVFQGGSLQMWKAYLGEGTKIYAIDIDPRCKQFEEENIKIFIGSQSDAAFLREVKSQIPDLDILLDDGGHTMRQQIVTFNELYDKVKDDGVYACEDLHTSYWSGYGGGKGRPGTFIEYSKKRIDQLNAFHSQSKRFKPTEFTRSTDSMHYYDSMLIIEKKRRAMPIREQTGQSSFEIPNLPFPNKLAKYKEMASNYLDAFLRKLGSGNQT